MSPVTPLSGPTSPRCNNGMLIHILSERFALYYTLFSDDMLRLNGTSITHGDASHNHLLQCQLIQESRRSSPKLSKVLNVPEQQLF